MRPDLLEGYDIMASHMGHEDAQQHRQEVEDAHARHLESRAALGTKKLVKAC